MTKTLKRIGFFVSALTLSACVSVLPDPDPAGTVYRLTTDAVRVTPNTSAPVIRIDTPSASRLLAGRQIIVSPDAKRVAVAGNAEWADALPKLIQQSFLDILGAKPEVIGVIPISGARSDFRVHINVDNFEARFDNGPSSAPLIIIGYSATFADSGTRNLIGTKQVTETIRAGEASVSSIVAGMDQANRSALGSIANWIGGLNLNN